MDNCLNTSKKILDLLRIPYTKEYLKDTVLTHPEHPSLLAIADAFDKYKIENLAISVGIQKLREMPLPCIIQVKRNHHTLFHVLKEFTGTEAICYDEKNALVRLPMESFQKSWTGVSLLVEKNPDSQEEGILKKQRAKMGINALKISVLALFLLWGLLSFSSRVNQGTDLNIYYTAAYTLVKLAGLVIGSMLLWFEVDEFNPTLQQFCSGGSKTDCNAVLNSKYARLFGDSLSLSTIAFSYFFGTLGYLLISGFSLSAMALLSNLSYLALPIILLSLYYQAFVIKQWCKFCIAIQLALGFEVLFASLSGIGVTQIEVSGLASLFALLLLPVLSWKLIKPLLLHRKQSGLVNRGLKKIKNNPAVLKSLLSKSDRLDQVPDQLGINIRRSTAEYNLIKVCNPFCGPCSKAHPVLEELVDKGKINLQIIFTANPDEENQATEVVRHFMALYSGDNELRLRKALDDWYRNDKKEYSNLSGEYPLNGELAEQTGQLHAMFNWCRDTGITHTPTVFIDGYELPVEYTIEDLKEVL
ncbi:MAG: cysteine peptidase family C39 domain-containing protein [Bacteroidota bacterium]